MDKRYLILPVIVVLTLSLLGRLRKPVELRTTAEEIPYATEETAQAPEPAQQAIAPGIISSFFQKKGPLDKNDYEIIKTPLQGVFAVQIGSKKVWATFSELRWSHCGEGKKERCVGFPSGETLKWREELAQYIPSSLARGHFGDYMRRGERQKP